MSIPKSKQIVSQKINIQPSHNQKINKLIQNSITKPKSHGLYKQQSLYTVLPKLITQHEKVVNKIQQSFNRPKTPIVPKQHYTMHSAYVLQVDIPKDLLPGSYGVGQRQLM
ncbi:Hypothetical_protein [Hexamita inflata]|uniref:Hypothetical_protein n=1 Tax=Hexamita inflata TaxID=28002 RepID=A0AA86NN90_9EUKA|nr:Hypothetical protein HINF_LOCUS9485 [Hexamita inflata]